MIEKTFDIPLLRDDQVRVLHPGEGEKLAGAYHPEVQRYADLLEPSPDGIYVLTCAMGAGEYYGSNINADYFPEDSLKHTPPQWVGLPVHDGRQQVQLQRGLGKQYAAGGGWGFTTFYDAKVFKHHQNKPFHPHFGHIALAVWNERMKRVELVLFLDHKLAAAMDASAIIRDIENGKVRAVSMGCRVPYDLCTYCTDWDLYYEVLRQYDPKKFSTPGKWVLHYHRNVKLIRGLAITQNDYCVHIKTMKNQLMPNGIRVAMVNWFPRFFDLSFVLIGADRIGKTMMKLASSTIHNSAYDRYDLTMQSAAASEVQEWEQREKVAAATATKVAEQKRAEVLKSVDDPTYHTVEEVQAREKDLPNDILDTMSSFGLPEALSSAAHNGIVLRPREFQRLSLIAAKLRNLADQLDARGAVFNCGASPSEVGPMLDTGLIHSGLSQLLHPFMEERSFFGPPLQKRMMRISMILTRPKQRTETVEHPLLDKISSAYSQYQNEMIKKAEEFAGAAKADPTVVGSMLVGDPLAEAFSHRGVKTAATESLLTKLSQAYLLAATKAGN